MGDPTDPPIRPFRIALDGGELIEYNGGPPELVLRLSAARAHSVAHVLDGCSRGRGVAVRDGAADRMLARTLEAATAALGETEAMRCAVRSIGTVGAAQRLAAVNELAEVEPRLTGVQRVAVIDAAARWLEDEAGDELAYALLSAVCGTDLTTNRVYVALLSPPVVSNGSGP
jgi:hypothetical protein